MSLPVAVLAIVAGLAILGGGGEILVRGSVSLARLAGLPAAVIGLTVVAMGTSLPELAVSLLAAMRDQPEIAVGNVLGSNIANIGLILGVTAVITVLPVRGNAIRVEWPVMFATSALAAVLMRDQLVDRVEGGLLVLSLVLFTAFSVWLGRREVRGVEAKEFEGEVERRSVHAARREMLVAVGLVAGGLVALVVGGRLLVDGAVSLARAIGMTERIIGLTIVAVGTSAPELAASIMAARRGHTDVAIANIIGSNVFNLLGILGATALIVPIPVVADAARVDAWWMIGFAALLFPMLRTGMRLTRREGIALLFAYFVYVALLLRS